MMARMTPVSLHFSDVPTGWKKIFTDKQQLATGLACSSRTVSPDEQCYRLICASCTQFHVPLGTQAFQLPQAASKQRSVPWCCRCGMFAAFTTADVACLPLKKSNRNFSSVFDVQRPFRAKGLRATDKSCNFPQFLTSNVHFVCKGCDWLSKVAIFPQFLTSNVHFVRKGCARQIKSCNFSSVFDVQRPFRAKGLRDR